MVELLSKYFIVGELFGHLNYLDRKVLVSAIADLFFNVVIVLFDYSDCLLSVVHLTDSPTLEFLL